MKKILVAVDGSSFSEGVFDYALEEAKELDNHLTIPRVVPIFEYGREDVSEGSEGEFKEAEEFVNRLKSKAEDNGVEADTEVLTGMDISMTIINYVKENDHDLIMVGGRGKSDLGTIHLGSVAEGVVKRAPCSVLVVH